MFGNRIPFRERMTRFLYGRNGPDTIYNVCIWTALALAIIGIFFDSYLISLLYLLLFGYALFRFFSRNVAKRRTENQIFCQKFAKCKQFFKFLHEKSAHQYKYNISPYLSTFSINLSPKFINISFMKKI